MTTRRRSVPHSSRNLSKVSNQLKLDLWGLLHFAPPAVEALVLLIIARLASALLNIVHDCDEVFNYWEPLHYLLYGFGFQTWEYSAEYALRSWTYILLHMPAAWPLRLIAGAAVNKHVVFFGTRALLGLLSAACDAWLYRVVQKRYGDSVAGAMFMTQLCSAGTLLSSTTMLPSSFSMIAMTAATAALLDARLQIVIVAAVVGAVLGWVVAAAAFVPYALYVLCCAPWTRSFATLFASLALTIAPLIAADVYFYGKTTVSLWNFVKYNVVGGGESALYGVEPWWFYLRNAALNFNIAAPAALLAPVVMLLSAVLRLPSRYDMAAAVAVAPLFVWLALISALPHKEERFLYIVYPQICFAAACSLASLQPIATRVVRAILPPKRASSKFVKQAVSVCVALTLVASAAVSLSRAAAQVIYYSAPMRVFRSLPADNDAMSAVGSAAAAYEAQRAAQRIHVCIAGEWHRFPSSFFLPSPQHRLHFLPSPFKGLLPAHFGANGTRGAPPTMNDRNEHQPAHELAHAADCNFLVWYNAAGNDSSTDELPVLPQSNHWQLIMSDRFVENQRSPQLYRALYIPWLSHKKVAWGTYALYEKALSAAS